ncbi:pentatricopeptide (PPR) repeat-containing protein [Actinidia rufa]|uniref:Pentatricopeptide (PPR) repeat-containing protein n=1 Tax=Actinidia rufa TaxID=165716 RepID=A0A7J0EIR1_9ERIC|nr:pentatricopeptide (PPR) repeat-containing protein [Actinidia rufa]
MNLKHLFSRHTINSISKLNGRTVSSYPYLYEKIYSVTTAISPSISSPNNQESTPFQGPKHAKPIPSFTRYIHSSQRTELSDSASDPKLDPEESEEDGTVSEFFSRFLWIMRCKLSEVYSDCDKKTIDDMLLIIVGKVVSEMEKGDLEQMLGAMRFKWAREKMEESEFYQSLEHLHEEESHFQKEEEAVHEKSETMGEEAVGYDSVVDEENPKVDNPSPLSAEWVELLQPNKVDWITLLDRLKENESRSYFKAHAKEKRLEDAERILKEMNEKGILPDILTFTVLVHMYSKAGNLERAMEAFENLKSQGFQPDMRIYNSMIMAYLGEVGGAQRIATTMQFAGFQPSLESVTLLVEAFGQAGDPDQARSNFDYMIKVGHRPDDRCIASTIAAYEKKNLLDKALNLLLEMEKDGFEPGVATYSVLMDWLVKLELFDEAEHLLGRIAEGSDTPLLKVHISLCDMYSRTGAEKKALQALGIVEAKKEQLRPKEFERIIMGLISGGFKQDAKRMHGLMVTQGFGGSEPLKMALMVSQAFVASQAIGRRRPTMR